MQPLNTVYGLVPVSKLNDELNKKIKKNKKIKFDKLNELHESIFHSNSLGFFINVVSATIQSKVENNYNEFE